MAMDDNSDGEVDPLGANSPDIGANLGPNPMMSEQQKGASKIASRKFFSTIHFQNCLRAPNFKYLSVFIQISSYGRPLDFYQF